MEFQEFPKWLYHPDGRTALVHSEAAQSELGGEWCPGPAEAAAERARRDEADEKRLALKIGAESVAAAAKKSK